jgi:TetR/AcrR family transcriptional regulator, regulator of autoinduction and epiphytic fitness
VKSRRSYNATGRRAASDLTRARIAAEALELFSLRGFGTTTVEEIARRAAVAPTTVYALFGGKRAILDGLVAEITAAPDLDVERAAGATDASGALAAGADLMRELGGRAWRVVDVLRSATGSDPELRALWREWQRRHREGVRRFVASLAERGSLRPTLSEEEATDLLHVIAGIEIYRELVVELGWSPAHYQRWLEEAAKRLLLSD